MNNFREEKVVSKNVGWIFGIVSIGLAIVSLEIFSRFIHCNANKSWGGWVFSYFLIIAAIGIWGLIKSRKHFKHRKWPAKILVILINILGIVLPIYLGYVAELVIFACTN